MLGGHGFFIRRLDFSVDYFEVEVFDVLGGARSVALQAGKKSFVIVRTDFFRYPILAPCGNAYLSM